MSSYLRPRRGKKATAVSQNIILKRGEVFFEVPDGGVGTGTGKIKMGDGTTAYDSLPYFLQQTTVDVANSTIAFTESTTTDNTTLLGEIVTGAKLNTLIGSIKKLLSNLDYSVTSLNNDFDSFKEAKSKIVSSALGTALSMTTSTTIADIATKIAGVANNGAVSGSITTSGGSYTIPAGYHNGSGKVSGPTLAALIGTNVTLASAANLLSGYTAYGKNGTKYTGTNKGYDAGYTAGKADGDVTHSVYADIYVEYDSSAAEKGNGIGTIRLFVDGTKVASAGSLTVAVGSSGWNKVFAKTSTKTV